MTELVSTNQDERYRHARAIFNARIDYWRKSEKLDLFTAFEILQQLAEENYGKAYYPLSILYETNQDEERCQDCTSHYGKLAFDWCYANRANRDAELWGDLGEMYLYGHSVDENMDQALFWHRKAAVQGYAESQFQLGHMYALGIVVSEDGKEVERWWRLAAAQGHAMALINLAYIYEGGQHDVPQNYEEAAKWYRIAADQGDYSAQTELYKMYAAGRGVPQDYEEAEKLFRQLLDRGYELATDLILVQEILRMQKELVAHKVV